MEHLSERIHHDIMLLMLSEIYTNAAHVDFTTFFWTDGGCVILIGTHKLPTTATLNDFF